MWLGDYAFALPAIGFVGTWLNIGLCLVLFLSGVGTSARTVRGGQTRRRQRATRVLLDNPARSARTDRRRLDPHSSRGAQDLRPRLRDDPRRAGTTTTVPAFEAYNRAFNTGQVGSAAAVAIALTIVIMIITALIGRSSRRTSHEDSLAREKVTTMSSLTLFAVSRSCRSSAGPLSRLPVGRQRRWFPLPTKFAFGNFIAAWTQGHFATYLFSSVLVTVSVVILTILLSVLAGFAFARLAFFGSTIIFFVLLAGLMLPAEAFIIPLYFDLRGLNLTDTYASLILPQTAQSLAFGVFWMRNQFRMFPSDVIEAARLDGANDLRVLWRVMVPPSIPAIATMSVLVAMWTWNEFLTPLIMITTDSTPDRPARPRLLPGRAHDELLPAVGRGRAGGAADRDPLLRAAATVHQRHGGWHLESLTRPGRPRTGRQYGVTQPGLN